MTHDPVVIVELTEHDPAETIERLEAEGFVVTRQCVDGALTPGYRVTGTIGDEETSASYSLTPKRCTGGGRFGGSAATTSASAPVLKTPMPLTVPDAAGSTCPRKVVVRLHPPPCPRVCACVSTGRGDWRPVQRLVGRSPYMRASRPEPSESM